jgi:putative ABC transport system permease protein
LKAEIEHSRLRIFNFLAAELKESFLMAMSALAAHKLRSALTLLGVLVGVFSIIVVMTAMKAMQKDIEERFNSLGGQTFVVSKWPGVFFGGPADAEKYWRRKELSATQGRTLITRATLPYNVGLETDFPSGDMSSRYAQASPDAELIGETSGSFGAQNWVVHSGRALSDADVEGYHDVCVLGSALATNLFPVGSPLNERIKFNSINYMVIGVLEPKGALAGGNQDNFALIPITTGLNRYAWRHQSVDILVQARSQKEYEDTIEQVRSILRTIRKVEPTKEDDFEIYSNDSLLSQVNSFTFAVRIGVMAVSSIALIAAGIGIMNIMLVSVTERTREIGIRRAIGAKKRNIMAQFIMEAVVLCEVGGVIGVVLGIAGGNLAGHFMNLPVIIPYDWAAIGLIICSLVGIVFGTYPAHKAANLDLIESLRYE